MLSESQIMEALAKCHPYVLSLVPKAIRAYADALDSDDLRLKIRVATKLFEGTGLFESRGNERFVETAAAVEQREEERRLIVGGLLTDMVMKKAEMYKLELPPDLEWLAPELRKLEKLMAERNKELTAQGNVGILRRQGDHLQDAASPIEHPRRARRR
jgi:hypothetical protein